MSRDKIFEGDSYAVAVTVTEPDFSPFDMSGATVTVTAYQDVTTVSGSVTISGANNEVAELFFGQAALGSGMWDVRLRVVKGSEGQTVWARDVYVE